MLSKRIAFLAFLACLVIPSAAFGQSWVDISPGVVYQSPGDPSCFTITVGDAAGMTIDIQYYYQGGFGEALGWLTLDGSGQAVLCADNFQTGDYVITGVRNSAYPGDYVPVSASLTVNPAPPPTPAIYALGANGDNGDGIWIHGVNFQQDSYVQVFSTNWSAYQFFYGPGSVGHPPSMTVSEDGLSISFQITDPAVLNAFGNGGVYVLVVNTNGTNSGWAWTHSPPPVISSATPGCSDYYCITLAGSFPLDAYVDFRIHGQPDILPNSYSNFNVTASGISLRLNPSVYYAFDSSGLDAWVVNPLLANWSNGYYIPPVDKNITGDINGITLSGFQYYVYGWACAKTDLASVDVWMYVGGPAGTGTWLGSGTANLDSEPGVAAACNSTGSHYRFSVPIPHSITQYYGGQAIYVHGISPFGLTSYLLGHSGAFTVPSVDLSVTGFVSGVVLEDQQYYLRGWACAKTYSGSINVQLFAGGPYGSGTFVTSATANQSSNPVTTAACGTGGTTYGFSILLTLALRQQFGGQAIFVHGISPFGLENSLIGNSGNLNFPPPVATSSKEYIYIGERLLAVDTTNLP